MNIPDNILKQKLQNMYFIWVVRVPEKQHLPLNFNVDMIVADLIELAAKHEIVICDGDIGVDAIMPIVTNAVCLSYWGNVSRDFFSRPDHVHMIDAIRNDLDLSESEKQEKIKNAYDLFSGEIEKITPREVTEYKLKHIVTDETTTIEEMVNMIENYFGFPKNEKIAL